MSVKKISTAYQLARERYAGLGVNTDTILKQLATVPVGADWLDGVKSYEKSVLSKRN